jgi:hypothetical protein
LSVNLDSSVQIKDYEGEFDDPENSLIPMPAVFCIMEQGSNELDNFVELDQKPRLYAVTSHMGGNGFNSMHTLLDDIITATHNQALSTNDVLFFRNFEHLITLPGMCVYSIELQINNIGG